MNARGRRFGGMVLLSVSLLLAGISGPTASVALAADPSPPASSAAPAASATPGPTLCESAADLALYVRFLRDQSLSEDGIVPILVGAAAAIFEAQRLGELIDATYRPLIAELRAALEELGASARSLRGESTLGTRIADLGTSITRVGLAMDALTTQLRTRCDLSGAAGSPAPSLVAPSPAA
jgi:hypothetical protein